MDEACLKNAVPQRCFVIGGREGHFNSRILYHPVPKEKYKVKVKRKSSGKKGSMEGCNPLRDPNGLTPNSTPNRNALSEKVGEILGEKKEGTQKTWGEGGQAPQSSDGHSRLAQKEEGD